ncbi:MAG: 1-acyl-sn-glycerol-3-phosphate acyltransferase [Lewinellaceae bacterium]|nr:1-acyl-sn-glycerol-3-phosphate acyltransferase [Lewinellaceae bacterium]
MKFNLRHQSSGQIYPYLETLTHAMYWGFFRKIHLHNRAGVPSDQPVLLAANHPTAFIDPCLLCSYLNPPIYNMARGDIFRKPFFRKLMESINMFPVYRVRDGYTGRDRNDQVFDYCVEKLQQKRVVAIYVEGEHHLEKRVRPAQKGLARIAFAAYEQHRSDALQIIPVGCNYRYGDRPRDEAMVNVGAPMYVRDYWQEYCNDPAFAIQHVCDDIEQALKSICYHIDDLGDDVLAEYLLTLVRSESAPAPWPVVVHNDGCFFLRKKALDQLNKMSATEKSAYREKVEQYFEQLDAAGLEDDALRNPQWGHAGRLLFFVPGLLPFVLGYISAWPLSRFAKYVADKKATKREFYSSVWMGVGFLTGIFYYLLLFIAGLLTGEPAWIALGLALPLLGWFSMIYKETWARFRKSRAALRSGRREVLLQMREAIMP